MLGHLIPYHFASSERWMVSAQRPHLLEMVRRWLQEYQTQMSKSAQHGSDPASRLASILSRLR
jgi:hypothetical protein